RPEQAFALGALGRLWLGGAAVSWSGFWQREERRRLRLPTYPFERRRYWIERGIERGIERQEDDRPAIQIATPDSPPQLAAAVATTRHSRPALPTPYEAPAGEDEAALAAIWEDLLGVAPVGRHDSFFDLGGHSLLGAQLISRLAEQFGAEV